MTSVQTIAFRGRSLIITRGATDKGARVVESGPPLVGSPRRGGGGGHRIRTDTLPLTRYFSTFSCRLRFGVTSQLSCVNQHVTCRHVQKWDSSRGFLPDSETVTTWSPVRIVLLKTTPSHPTFKYMYNRMHIKVFGFLFIVTLDMSRGNGVARHNLQGSLGSQCLCIRLL